MGSLNTRISTRGTDVDGVTATFKNGVLEVATPYQRQCCRRKSEVKELAEVNQ
jgi:HSP20 family molecular chaperone IbpA